MMLQYVTRFLLAIALIGFQFASLSLRSFAGEKAPLAEFLPADTAIYVGIDSAKSLSEKAQQTDFAKILQLDGIKQFVDQVQARKLSPDSDGAQLLEYLQLLGEGSGKSSLAIVERPKAVSAIALLIEVKEEGPKFTELLSKMKAKLENTGFASRAVSSPSEITTYEKATGAKNAIQCWFQTPTLVCIANDLELAQAILAKATDASKGEVLAANPLFRESLDSCANVQSPAIWVYAIPTSIAYLTQADPDDSVDPRQLLQKHGFDSLQAIAMKVELASNGLELQYDLYVQAPKPFAKAMQMLEFAPSQDLDPPAWLSDDLNNVIRLQWNVTDLLKHLGGPADEVMEQEGFFQGMLDDLKSDVGPGVDLQKDLFEFLESPVLVIGRSEAEVSTSSEHTLVAIKAKDEAKVAAAVRKLLIDDPTAKREVVPPSSELWRLGGGKPIGGKGAGIQFKSSGIIVLDGYLIMSSNVDGIKRLIESMNAKKPPLAQSADYLDAKHKFGPAANMTGIVRVYFSMSRDMRTSYELLRQGKIESAESIYGQLLAPIIAADRKSGAAYDFSKLPDFEKLRPLLGVAFAHGIETDKGWKVRGIISKSPAAKAAK